MQVLLQVGMGIQKLNATSGPSDARRQLSEREQVLGELWGPTATAFRADTP